MGKANVQQSHYEYYTKARRTTLMLEVSIPWLRKNESGRCHHAGEQATAVV